MLHLFKGKVLSSSEIWKSAIITSVANITGSFVIEGCRTSSTATKMSIKAKRMSSAAPLFSLLTCTFPQQNHQLHRLSLELMCYMLVPLLQQRFKN